MEIARTAEGGVEKQKFAKKTNVAGSGGCRGRTIAGTFCVSSPLSRVRASTYGPTGGRFRVPTQCPVAVRQQCYQLRPHAVPGSRCLLRTAQVGQMSVLHGLSTFIRQSLNPRPEIPSHDRSVEASAVEFGRQRNFVGWRPEQPCTRGQRRKEYCEPRRDAEGSRWCQLASSEALQTRSFLLGPIRPDATQIASRPRARAALAVARTGLSPPSALRSSSR